MFWLQLKTRKTAAKTRFLLEVVIALYVAFVLTTGFFVFGARHTLGPPLPEAMESVSMANPRTSLRLQIGPKTKGATESHSKKRGITSESIGIQTMAIIIPYRKRPNAWKQMRHFLERYLFAADNVSFPIAHILNKKESAPRELTTSDLYNCEDCLREFPFNVWCAKERICKPKLHIYNTIGFAKKTERSHCHIRTKHWRLCRKLKPKATRLTAGNRLDKTRNNAKQLSPSTDRSFRAMGKTQRSAEQRHFFLILVEQMDDFPFNRGLLLNIGAKYALQYIHNVDFDSEDTDNNRELKGSNATPKQNASGSRMWNVTHLIFHDVDFMPTAADKSMYWRVPRSGEALAVFNSFSCRPPQWWPTGGALSLSRAMFQRGIGWVNDYFGWGKEDRALFRLLRANGANFTQAQNHALCLLKDHTNRTELVMGRNIEDIEDGQNENEIEMMQKPISCSFGKNADEMNLETDFPMIKAKLLKRTALSTEIKLSVDFSSFCNHVLEESADA